MLQGLEFTTKYNITLQWISTKHYFVFVVLPHNVELIIKEMKTSMINLQRKDRPHKFIPFWKKTQCSWYIQLSKLTNIHVDHEQLQGIYIMFQKATQHHICTRTISMPARVGVSKLICCKILTGGDKNKKRKNTNRRRGQEEKKIWGKEERQEEKVSEIRERKRGG